MRGCIFNAQHGQTVHAGAKTRPLMSNRLDGAASGSAMLGLDTEVGRAREHRPLSRGSSDGPQPYQGRPSVGPAPPSRCGPATLPGSAAAMWQAAVPYELRGHGRRGIHRVARGRRAGRAWRARHGDRQPFDRQAVESRWRPWRRRRAARGRHHGCERDVRDLRRGQARARVPPGRPDRRPAFRSGSGRRRSHQRPRDHRGARGGADGRRAPARQQLDRRRPVRRRRRDPHPGGPSDPAPRPLRPVEVLGRGLLRAVHAACTGFPRCRCATATSTDHARTCTARPGWWRSSADVWSTAGGRPCSATGARPATGSR